MMMDLIVDIVQSWYNCSFPIFYAVTNVFLLLVIIRKVVNHLLSREEDKRGHFSLITGCDTGFGNATAYELNKRGIHVFAACLTADAVTKFTDDVNFKGTAFIMNVTKEEDVKKTKEMIEEAVGDKGLWSVYNNAGILEPGPIDWVSIEDMQRTVEINLWGTVRVAKAMIPLVKMARGRFVNTASIAGRITVPSLAAYHMSKYSVEAFSDSLRYEMKPWGVSVHIIEPGVMMTNLYDRLKQRWTYLWENLPEEKKAWYGKDDGQDVVKEFVEKGEVKLRQLAGKPKHVVDAYLHAGLSTRPSARYLVGIDAHILAVTMGLLPTFMGDFICGILAEQPKMKI